MGCKGEAIQNEVGHARRQRVPGTDWRQQAVGSAGGVHATQEESDAGRENYDQAQVGDEQVAAERAEDQRPEGGGCSWLAEEPENQMGGSKSQAVNRMHLPGAGSGVPSSVAQSAAASSSAARMPARPVAARAPRAAARRPPPRVRRSAAVQAAAGFRALAQITGLEARRQRLASCRARLAARRSDVSLAGRIERRVVRIVGAGAAERGAGDRAD
jgi:hypothetical protein